MRWGPRIRYGVLSESFLNVLRFSGDISLYISEIAKFPQIHQKTTV